MICIPVLQFKLVWIIDGTLHIDDPSRLPNTINTRKLKIKENGKVYHIPPKVSVQYQQAYWSWTEISDWTNG